MKYYTGIGSRDIPVEVAERMADTCKRLAEMGYVLRSGAADGSDTVCEVGCDGGGGSKEIYLPHMGFNQHESELYLENMDEEIVKKAESMASDIHPAWDSCSPFAKKSHSRNIMQVLGQDLQTPSEFVICYTWNGKAVGGTATAMNLAKRLGIPVYNFYNDGVEKFIELM